MLSNQQVAVLDSSFGTVRQPSKPSTVSAWTQHAPPLESDIETLLFWTYARHQAHRNEKFGVSGGPGGYVDSTIRCERNATMGGLGNSGFGFAFRELGNGRDVDMIHPAALTVHGCVGILDDLSVGLVIQHAWTATRPDWGGPLKLLRPCRKPSGKIKAIYDNAKHPIGSLIASEELDHNQGVLFAREVYTHWWSALLILADECRRALPMLTIMGPAAPELPWLDPILTREWLDRSRK
jgi:hypothetical protein